MKVLNEVSAGIILFCRKKKVLLIRQKQWNYRWFPKWHTEGGETLQQTAKREFLEETWIQVVEDSFFVKEPFEVNYEYYRWDDLVKKKLVFFAANVECESKIDLQEEEIFECEFLEIEKARNLLEENSFEYENSQLSIFDRILEIL